MVRKNPKGKRGKFLTDTEKDEIRRLHSTGLNFKQIAYQMQRNEATVRNVVLNVSWKEYRKVPPPKPHFYERCKGCGAKVKKPCLACKLKQQKA